MAVVTDYLESRKKKKYKESLSVSTLLEMKQEERDGQQNSQYIDRAGYVVTIQQFDPGR
jgi:hypothetical protein